MIFEKEPFTKTRIEDIEMANMITKNWYAICDLTKTKNFKTKVMKYEINDLIYDIYATKKNDKIFFEAFAHDEYCKKYGCVEWKHQQLTDFFLHDEEESFITFYTRDIEILCERVKKDNKYWEDVQYGMYLFVLDGKVSSYG